MIRLSNRISIVLASLVVVGYATAGDETEYKPCNCFKSNLSPEHFPFTNRTCGQIAYYEINNIIDGFCYVGITTDSGTCDFTYKCEYGAAGVTNYTVNCSISVQDKDPVTHECIPGSTHNEPWSFSNCKTADPEVEENDEGCGGWA